MFWYGASYFARVNEETKHPIFTLQTMTARTVVVIDPYLAAPIQRASKNLSFYGMILEVFADMLNSFLPPTPNATTTPTTLMTFVKQIFTPANAYTFYGPKNPFALHPSLIDKFWDYEAGMIAVMADLIPSLTARKPYLARQSINAALHEFVQKDHYRLASPMIQKRVQINLKHGLTPQMAGRAELILLFGIIGNAVPTTFWFLAYIFARPDLVAAIRAETRARGVVSTAFNPRTGTTENTISVTALKAKCPLIMSTYRETLRSIGNLSSVRLVTGTHTVTVPGYRSYVLKKGVMVQIASGVIHSLESVWGADAKTFNPNRFLSPITTTTTTTTASSSKENGDTYTVEKTATALPKGVPSAAFRTFGGGSVICPGRHFAMTEIVGFVALCVNMFEVVDAETGAAPEMPVRDDRRIPLSVMKPVREPRILMKRRVGQESVVWRLEV
ncbi:cytochrome P450 [Periconia macrospinosa]|uniref:Cytochrome P450 n=1 Tax=Periconia macrospinosa TaxID=97972 RepID=A0A2V1DF88_9PLEO|nr:cytochrome P450 [Periconia macrospinosa]